MSEWKEKAKDLDLESQWNELYKIKKAENFPALWANGDAIGNAKNIIDKLPDICKEYGIKSILDIGCGNLIWMSQIDLEGVDYTGADIVEDLVKSNNEKYPDIKCIHLDITKEIPSQYDLILIRSVFIHLTLEDCLRSISNIVLSGSKYILVNSHYDVENLDTSCLMLKKRDMQKSPFNFPKPLFEFDETDLGYVKMELYDMDDIR